MTPYNASNNLTFEAADMAEGLKFLKRSLADTRCQIPILHHVYFPGDGTARTSDLDQEGIWRLTGATCGHEPFTVAYRALEKIISGADKGAIVTIAPPPEEGEHGRDGKAVVLADGMQSRLCALPGRDFPERKDLGQQHIAFTMPGDEIRDILAFVNPCVSTEETRYYLNGVYFHPDNGVLKAVTTDGHKLALRTTDHAWQGEREDGAIVPTPAARAALASLGKKHAGNVSVSIYARGVTFETEKWVIRSRIVDGTFPDYTRVIPQGNTSFAALPVPDTLKAINRLAKLSGTNNGKRSLLDTGAAEITLRDADSDTHTLPLKGCRMTGDEIAVGFNIGYLKAAFETFDGAGSETVNLALATTEPTKMTAPGIDGCWVLMPMRY